MAVSYQLVYPLLLAVGTGPDYFRSPNEISSILHDILEDVGFSDQPQEFVAFDYGKTANAFFHHLTSSFFDAPLGRYRHGRRAHNLLYSDFSTLSIGLCTGAGRILVVTDESGPK